MLGNKEIMARNIKKYLDLHGITAAQICDDLNIPKNTFSDWVNAKTYPRIDKIELMARYFHIQKADLVEAQNDPKVYHTWTIGDTERDLFMVEMLQLSHNMDESQMDRILEYAKMILAYKGDTKG